MLLFEPMIRPTPGATLQVSPPTRTRDDCACAGAADNAANARAARVNTSFFIEASLGVIFVGYIFESVATSTALA